MTKNKNPALNRFGIYYRFLYQRVDVFVGVSGKNKADMVKCRP